MLGATVGLVSACHGPTNELHPGQEHLGLAERPSLGRVLVDDEGRTVYLFEKDEPHESYCTGACASVWPPVTTSGMPVVSDGVDASKVTLIRRDDGLMQVAYAGHPLYYYQADTSSDDSYGQDLDQFGAGWYAVSATGSQAETDSSSRSSSQDGGSSSGGSYG
jgi:predicted lipoprotein with Yx(FWY)xxD motif